MKISDLSNFQLDDNEYSIPRVDMMPSLESVLSELDADSDVISDMGDRFTPTPSIDDRPRSGTMLRHIILQGVTAQMASASVITDLWNFSFNLIKRVSHILV